MAGVNKVILLGRLGKDPEVRTLDNGTKVCSMTIATSENYTDKDGQKQEKTEWHNIVLWRKLAELAESYLAKGREVYLEGKLQTRSYEQEGVKKYTTEIVATNLNFIGSKSDGGGNNSAPAPSMADAPAAQPATTSNLEQGDDDDLPF